jgi:hypothetical protein
MCILSILSYSCVSSCARVCARICECGITPINPQTLTGELITISLIQVEALLSLRTTDTPTHSEDDALFLGAFIAHKLDHVMHFERDIDARRRGDELNNPFETLISNAHIA